MIKNITLPHSDLERDLWTWSWASELVETVFSTCVVCGKRRRRAVRALLCDRGSAPPVGTSSPLQCSAGLCPRAALVWAFGTGCLVLRSWFLDIICVLAGEQLQEIAWAACKLLHSVVMSWWSDWMILYAFSYLSDSVIPYSGPSRCTFVVARGAEQPFPCLWCSPEYRIHISVTKRLCLPEVQAGPDFNGNVAWAKVTGLSPGGACRACWGPAWCPHSRGKAEVWLPCSTWALGTATTPPLPHLFCGSSGWFLVHWALWLLGLSF